MIESGGEPDGPAATIKIHHNVGGLPEELGFELIEVSELLGLGERCMIRDVIGDADELVEGQDGAAMTWMNKVRGDGKILVAMGLA